MKIWNFARFAAKHSALKMNQSMSRKSLHSVEICVKCDKTPTLQHQPTFAAGTVCKETDLEDNKMRIVQLQGNDVLMIKQDGKISAVGAKCPHYGAPLCKSALGNNRIRCQWHGACFDLNSGDIEDFPGLDSLPKYDVKLSAGNVTIRAEKCFLTSNKRQRPFVTKDPKDKRTYVIVGGGAAGNMCAQTLREEGFTGRIVLVCGEKCLPYDRIKLTKALFAEIEQLRLRCHHFFEERNIELHLGEHITSLNVKENLIEFKNGGNVRYDKLFIATGVRAAKLEVPGADLKNIYTLRDIDDNAAISGTLNSDTEVVVFGGSFIALEIASTLHPIVKKLTIVSRTLPFKNAFGRAVALRIMQHFQEKGIKLIVNTTVKSFIGTDGILKYVLLEDGTKVKADICVLGVGVLCNTEYLKKAMPIQKDGSIEVDDHLRTHVKNVFAGGDIAYAPVLGTKATIRHWQLAQYHGRIAALNMVDKPTKLNSIPFFWTTLYGKGFRYCGFTPEFKSVEIRGKLEDLKFAAFYVIDGGIVGAVLTVDKDPVAANFGELLHSGGKLSVNDIDSWLEKAS